MCIESFTINGRASDYDPETFKCSTCEEIYEVTWDMVSGNTCNFLWGYTFIGNKDIADGPFDGFLMFDTHNSFGTRNEDNAALVVSAMLNTNATSYYQDRDYGKGTAAAKVEAMQDAGIAVAETPSHIAEALFRVWKP